MRVRLLRKLADQIDGIDLSGCVVGEVIDLPDRKASMLLAEGWALIERRAAAERRHSSIAVRTPQYRRRRK